MRRSRRDSFWESTREDVSKEDIVGVEDYMAHAGGSPRCVNAYLDRLAARTSLYIQVYWSGVETVAAELLDRRAIPGPEVEALLRGTRGRNSTRL